ncbi:hypothetical protein CVT26_012549, partial [Gymnopilus dilepis]
DGKRQRNALVDNWRTSSYDVCRKKKKDFWNDNVMTSASQTVQYDFQRCWRLAEDLCEAIAENFSVINKRRSKARRDAEDAADERQKVLEAAIDPRANDPIIIAGSLFDSPRDIREDSERLWGDVYKCLEKRLGEDFKPLLSSFQYFEPSFDVPPPNVKQLQEDFKKILYPDVDRPDGPLNRFLFSSSTASAASPAGSDVFA